MQGWEVEIELTAREGLPSPRIPMRVCAATEQDAAQWALRLWDGADSPPGLDLVAIRTRPEQWTVWSDIDWTGRLVQVRYQLAGDGSQELWRLKTTRSRRVVPMLQEVHQELRRRHQSRSSAWVFESEAGGPLDRHNVYRAVRRTCRATDLDVTVHDLRHTFASHWVMSGGAIRDLQELLGHSSLQETLRYAHLAPRHLTESMGRFEDYISRPTAEVVAFSQGVDSSTGSTPKSTPTDSSET